MLHALTDDQDAMAVLRSCGISLADLRDQLATYIENELTYLTNIEAEESKPTSAFQRFMHCTHRKNFETFFLSGRQLAGSGNFGYWV